MKTKCDVCDKEDCQENLINITPESSDDLKEEYKNCDGMVCDICYSLMKKESWYDKVIKLLKEVENILEENSDDIEECADSIDIPYLANDDIHSIIVEVEDVKKELENSY